MDREPLVKEGSYVSIQAFMVNDLHLSGNELIVYAVIYGFSQDGESWFVGSRRYLAEWCQTSEKSVTNNLQKLLSKGLIRKRQKVEHGCTFNDYQAVIPASTPGKKVPSTGEESSLGTGEESSPHTIEGHKASKINMGTGAKFSPPTREEVRAYIKEKCYHFDADHFFDYYEASGWHMQNGKRVTRWKQCCVTWEKNHSDDPKPTERGRLDDYNFRK